MSSMSTLRNRLVRFHNNEEGLEALQVVMIIAVAALVLILIKTSWEKRITPFFKEMLENVTGWKDTSKTDIVDRPK